jgi:hypothetical protein
VGYVHQLVFVLAWLLRGGLAVEAPSSHILCILHRLKTGQTGGSC